MKMLDLKLFTDRIKESIPIEDVINTLEKLPNDPAFNQLSQSAGTVGGIIKLALFVTNKVYIQGGLPSIGRGNRKITDTEELSHINLSF